MLARVFVSGELTVEGVCARAAATLGREWKWMRGLARRFLRAHAGKVRPREQDAVAFFRQDRRFQQACERYGSELRVRNWIAGEPEMQPVLVAARWPVPALGTEGELAAWLGLSEGELAWFADLKRLNSRPRCPRELRQYHCRWMEKRTGGLRLVESPKERMKGLQRQILRQVLNRVPHHEAVHGYVRGRSIRSFAAVHAGRGLVVRMDLKDFFPSVRQARVQGVFECWGIRSGWRICWVDFVRRRLRRRSGARSLWKSEERCGGSTASRICRREHRLRRRWATSAATDWIAA